MSIKYLVYTLYYGRKTTISIIILKEHFFVEVLGLQVQIIKAGDGPEKERWVFGPDVVLDFEGKPMTGANCDMFWYRWV